MLLSFLRFCLIADPDCSANVVCYSHDGLFADPDCFADVVHCSYHGLIADFTSLLGVEWRSHFALLQILRIRRQ